MIERLQGLAVKERFDLLVSAYRYCPDAMDNLRSISTELASQLGQAPDHVFVPVGGGGLLTAIWRGFSALRDAGHTSRMPRIHAVQPAGNPTVYDAWKAQRQEIRTLTSTTQISGLSVPFDIDASQALDARVRHQRMRLRADGRGNLGCPAPPRKQEGIYSEPAGATALAGAIQAIRSGCVQPSETVVRIVTGHGFKDASAAERMSDGELPLLAPEEISDLHLSETALPASYFRDLAAAQSMSRPRRPAARLR